MTDDPSAGGRGARFYAERAVDTRRRLTRAYVHIATHQPATLTVTSICKLARVGRSTFYTHFSTVDELALGAVTDSIHLLLRVDVERRKQLTIPRVLIADLGVREFVDSLGAVRALLQTTIDRRSRGTIQAGLIEAVAESLEDLVRSERPDFPERVGRLQARFVASGLVQVVLDWISASATDESPDELIEQIVYLLPHWMKADD